MKCPSCSADVSEKALFCPHCGEEMDARFCVECGGERGKKKRMKFDTIIFLVVAVGISSWLGWNYFKTHEDEVTAQVKAGVANLTERGEAVILKGLNVGAGVAEGLLEKGEENEVPDLMPVTGEEFEVIEDEEIPDADKATHDLKVVVGPGLSQEELIKVAHAVLDGKILEAPEEVFVLAVFDGEPSGSSLLAEDDARFVAKFLHLKEMIGEPLPDEFVSVGDDLWVMWK